MIAQVLLNGIIAGSQYALMGVGFALVYRVTHVFHFAHGAVFAAGAYGAYVGHEWLGFSLATSTCIGVATSCLFGSLVELGVYRPLRRRAAPNVVFLLASLGVYIFLQNLISLTFGDNVRTLRDTTVSTGLEVLGARITPAQLAGLVISAVVVLSVAVLLRYARVGKAIRAVADEPLLAEVSGVSSTRVILFTVALASAIAGFGGVIIGLDIDISPTMGLRLLMMGVVAFVVGGTGNAMGVAVGALLLGMLQHIGAWILGSQWQDAIAFVLLLIVLVAKPSGLLGRRFSWQL